MRGEWKITRIVRGALKDQDGSSGDVSNGLLFVCTGDVEKKSSTVKGVTDESGTVAKVASTFIGEPAHRSEYLAHQFESWYGSQLLSTR